jgi:hypothetical protein
VNCSTVTIVSCAGEIPGATRTDTRHRTAHRRTTRRARRAPGSAGLPSGTPSAQSGRSRSAPPARARAASTWHNPLRPGTRKTTAHQSSATPGPTAGSIGQQGRDQGKRPVSSPEQALGCGTRAVAATGQRPDGQPRAGPSTVCGRSSLWSPTRFTDPQGGGRSDAGVVVVVVRRELSDLYSAARCQRRQPAVGPRVLQGGSGGAPVGQAVQAADRAHRVPDDL